MQETCIQSLGWEDPLEKGKAIQYFDLENSMDFSFTSLQKCYLFSIENLESITYLQLHPAPFLSVSFYNTYHHLIYYMYICLFTVWYCMRTVVSLEKTLMLWKTQGKRRRGQQRMRWLDSITYSMDMNLSKRNGRWWRTGKPGVLQPMGSKRVQTRLSDRTTTVWG